MLSNKSESRVSFSSSLGERIGLRRCRSSEAYSKVFKNISRTAFSVKGNKVYKRRDSTEQKAEKGY